MSSRSRSPYLPLFDRAPDDRDARPEPRPPREEPREEVFSVLDLANRLRQRVQTLGQVVVEGEVSGFRGPAPTGHLYFTLKDERADACVSCAMFRREAQLAGGDRIANGARVRLRATPEVFAPRGALQLVVQRAMAAGEGDLAARREALKRKLSAEGLFDEARKRPLPSEPRVIGVVTSPTGAAFHDIVKVARRRGRVPILLSPAQVQGDVAAAQLRRALERLARVAEVDVIIIGRGGGSAEDLAAFDDEDLARAIAACPKPVVAAVGHEVDWSIACLVADVRAATPSQAAELVVPDHAARRDRLAEGLRRLTLAMRSRMQGDAATLARLDRRVRAPERALAMRRQLVDDLADRMAQSMRGRIAERAREKEHLERRLAARHPRTVLADSRRALAPLPFRLRAAIARVLEQERSRVAMVAHKLDAISPLAVLARGYAIALGPDGRAVRDARDVRVGDRLSVRLDRGAVDAEVTATHPPDDDE
ncbi:MAG: exodeoxyribonuclease VII large subunit [Deltaproteobacteria bacterium]|nr:exodeoxyribonuclease VII large subunit [Deltaproteobacteria bacterium]